MTGDRVVISQRLRRNRERSIRTETDHGVHRGRSRRSQPLARIATVGPDGQPDVAPVGFEFDGTYLYVGGRAPERTRKFLNVKAGQAKVALVVDDLVSTDPWTPRGLRVYGSADLIEREGMFGPGAYMRITPEISWSWNLAGQPYGSGSGPRRTVH